MKEKNNLFFICFLIIIFLVSLFLSACTMPRTKIYSLNIDYTHTEYLKSKFADKSLAVIVNAPRHLSQPYIVYRHSPYEMEISKYSRWDSTPQEIIKKNLKDYLSFQKIFKEVKTSYTYQEGFYILEIDLKKFERFDSKNDSYGELLFDYTLLSSEGNEIASSSIHKKEVLKEKSFLELAKILSNALNEACIEMKDKFLTD